MRNQSQVGLPPDRWLLPALTAAEVSGETRHRRVASHLCDNRNDISKEDNNSCNLLSARVWGAARSWNQPHGAHESVTGEARLSNWLR